MKKTLVILVAMVCLLGVSLAVSRLTVAQAQIPDKAYFDEQFNRLERSLVEVKADTTESNLILGKVFEGTVPRGGTLDELCKKNEWKLFVLMGHNGIEDPNKVVAGAKFEYPRTIEEYKQASKKGKSLYDSWLSPQKITFRVNRIKADTMELEEFNTKFFRVTQEAKIQKATIDELRMRIVEITEELRIKEEHIGKLVVDQEYHKDAVYDKLHIKQLEVDNLRDLLAQAQVRCRELEARPPVVVEKAVPVTPGPVQFRQDNDCGKPYYPKSWEWRFIKAAQAEGVVPVFWYLNRQPDGTLKVKVDYFDADTGLCYTVWCQRNLPHRTQSALPEVQAAGFTADEGVAVKDGGRHQTLEAGRVTNWLPGMVVQK